MSDNPYAIPDEEFEEVLGEKAPRKHALDGSVCPACGIAHDVHGADIPPEVLDKLSQVLDGIPSDALHSQIIVTRSTPGRSRVIQDFVEFAQSVDHIGLDAPLLRAMGEVLNEMSHGKVARLWHVYETERSLITTHTILKAVNVMCDGVETKLREQDGADKDSETLLELLHLLRNSVTDRLAKAVDRYREEAGSAGVEINDHLIDTGLYDEENSDGRSQFLEGMTRVAKGPLDGSP